MAAVVVPLSGDERDRIRRIFKPEFETVLAIEADARAATPEETRTVSNRGNRIIAIGSGDRRI